MTYFLKKHKLIAWIVMLTFLFSMVMPTNLVAGNSVAEAASGDIDSYQILANKINNPGPQGTATVKITNDITVTGTITIGNDKNITLDLNGHKLTAGTNVNPIFNITGGKLTIVDNKPGTSSVETMTSVTYGNTAKYENGTLTYYVTETAVKAGSDTGATVETLKKYTVSNTGMIVGNNSGRAVTMSGGELNLNGGYILNFKTTGDNYGGAINVTSGTLNLNGTVLAANQAPRGGAIRLDGGNAVMNMLGGYITGNIATGADGGGGVYAQNGADITMTGGYITNNKVNGKNDSWGNYSGGGLSVMNSGSNLTLNGGYITGNQASGGGGALRVAHSASAVMNSADMFISGNNSIGLEGGGITVDNDGYFELEKGYITNNIAGRGAENGQNDPADGYPKFPHWGGGGLFCADSGAIIRIKSALITENKAGGFGGGVAGCSTGRINVNEANVTLTNSAIFDNTALGQHMSIPGVTTKNDDREVAEASSTFMSNGYADYYCALSSVVSNSMLGGGTENWAGSMDLEPVPSPTPDVLASGYVMGLTAKPTQEDINKAKRAATAFINGNESPTHGGGILANGYLIIGNSNELDIFSRLELEGEKQLLDKDGQKQNLEDGQFEFKVLQEVTGEDGTPERIHVMDGVSDENGIVKFLDTNGGTKRISFTETEGFISPGENKNPIKNYTYYVVEKTGDDTAVTYDDTEYRINVIIEKTGTALAHDIKKNWYKFQKITVTKLEKEIGEDGQETVKEKVLYSGVKNDEQHAVYLKNLLGNTPMLFTNQKVETKEVSVTKEWADSGDAAEKRPENVTVQLQSSLDKGATWTVEEEIVLGNAADTVVDENDNADVAVAAVAEEPADPWKATRNVPKYGKTADGTKVEYQYRFVELTPDNEEIIVTDDADGRYNQDYSVQVSVTADAWTITNAYDPVIDVTAVKVWDDNSDADKKRPDSVTFRLYADGEETEIADVVLTADDAAATTGDQWIASFDNLPKYNEGGTEIEYTVKELAPEEKTPLDAGDEYNDDYIVDAVDVDTDDETGNVTVTITNSLKGLQVTSISGTKVWVDNIENHDNTDEITLNLYRTADGMENPELVTVDEESGINFAWDAENPDKYTFSNLPKYNEAGKVYTYYVTEEAMDGYVTTYKDVTGEDAEAAYKDGIIINTAVVDVTGTKVWVDGNKTHDNAKDITLYLFRTANDVSELVEATPEWDEDAYTFTDLPKYDAQGKEYTYSVVERLIPGYITDYGTDEDGNKLTAAPNGGTITNMKWCLGQINLSKQVVDPKGLHTGDTFYFTLKLTLVPDQAPAVEETQGEETGRTEDATNAEDPEKTEDTEKTEDVTKNEETEKSEDVTKFDENQEKTDDAEKTVPEQQNTSGGNIVNEDSTSDIVSYSEKDLKGNAVEPEAESLTLQDVPPVPENVPPAPVQQEQQEQSDEGPAPVEITTPAVPNEVPILRVFLNTIDEKTGELVLTEITENLIQQEDGSYIYGANDEIALQDGQTIGFTIMSVGCTVDYEITENEVTGLASDETLTVTYGNDKEATALKGTIGFDADGTATVLEDNGTLEDVEDEETGEVSKAGVVTNTYTYKKESYDPPYTPPEKPDKKEEKPPVVPIDDPEVPQGEPEEPVVEPIDEPDVPLVDVPGEEVVEVVDTPVPLGDAPAMGDSSNAVAFAMVLLAAGFGLVVTRRKFN